VPRPSGADLLRAWWGEVRVAWAVFGWHQPFAADREPDLPGELGQTGVLLLHGYVCNRGLWAPWQRRLHRLGVPCTALTLEPVFGGIDRYAPAIEAAVRDMTRRPGRPPLLVGHSMGGLAARAWLASLAANAEGDASERIAGVITIGTPHQGTWTARFGLSTNARQMRLGSAWLAALAVREPAGRHARFVCFFGHADNLVFPARMATLAGADNRHLAGVAHLQMVFEPAVFEAVLAGVGVANAAPR
jgi:pimeloyl-ACP methyl ester carboxylesterase